MDVVVMLVLVMTLAGCLVLAIRQDRHERRLKKLEGLFKPDTSNQVASPSVDPGFTREVVDEIKPTLHCPVPGCKISIPHSHAGALIKRMKEDLPRHKR